jgi:predicted nucleotidyltransferase
MIDRQSIEDLGHAIAEGFHPERIILFGSHARGTARDGSDVDLLVVMPFEGNSIHQSVAIIQRLNPKFSVDILARTPEEIEKRLKWKDPFILEILGHGEVLYESTYA